MQYPMSPARMLPSKARVASALVALGWGIGLLLLCLFVGAVVAVGGVYSALGITALLMFGAGLLIPVEMLFVMMVGIVYLVVGQLQYFARIDKAFWIPYLLGLFLYIRLLALQVIGGSRKAPPQSRVGTLSMWLFALFAIVGLVSSLTHKVGPLQWFVAGKEYLFLWGALLAFLMGAVRPQRLEKLILFAPWFLALQVPVVLYQRFVVAPKRLGDSAFDAVVGLFGGDPNGGGASGAMGMFSLVVIGLSVEAWRAGVISRRRMIATIPMALVPILFGEVKFMLVLLPVLFMMLFGREVARRPAKALVALAGGAVAVFALLMAYQAQYTSNKTTQGKSLSGYIETVLTRNTDADAINLRTGEMGRIAAFTFWARSQARLGGPNEYIMGHGIGATKVGGMVIGDVARKFQFRLGRSSLVIYLWEIGLLGAGAMVGGLATCVVTAFRLARHPALAEQRWMLRGAGMALFLILLGLPYNTDFVEVAQIQLLAFSLIGYMVVTGRSVALRKPPAMRQAVVGA